MRGLNHIFFLGRSTDDVSARRGSGPIDGGNSIGGGLRLSLPPSRSPKMTFVGTIYLSPAAAPSARVSRPLSSTLNTN